MNINRNLGASLVLVVLMSACTSGYVENMEKPKLVVSMTIGRVRTNLGTPSNFGVHAGVEDGIQTVDTSFMDELAATLQLTNAQSETVQPSVMETNYAQERPLGSNRRQPAQIVVDGSSASGSGWNRLSFAASKPVVWGELPDQMAGTAFFRGDSYPVVSEMRLYDNQVSVYFSEPVDNVVDNPFIVSQDNVELTCGPLSWGSNGTGFTCSANLTGAVRVTLKNGYLSANGNPVLSIEGTEFDETVTVSELPKDREGLPIWRAALP